MKNCGIYKIVNIENNKYYLGSSVNIAKRFKRHVKDLLKGKHHSMHLQRSFNKYGESKFKLETLKVCKKEELFIFEQKYLDDLMPWDSSIGFNVSRSASGGNLISNHPDKKEIIEKMTNTMKEKSNNMTEKERKEKWGRKAEKNGNWKNGKTYFKCPICGVEYRTTNYPKTCIKCRDISGQKNGFFGKKHSKETIEKITMKNKGRKPKSSQKISINGKIYLSMNDAAKDIGVCTTTIINRSKNAKFPNYKKID